MIKKLNKTLIKFGYPETIIKEYDNWVILLRKEQTTLGALVLICKENATEFSKITIQANNELPRIIKEIETVLNGLFKYDRINYLMLMMVDPNVHYHIVPRYANQIKYEGFDFKDVDWPSKPSLGNHNIIEKDLFSKLKNRIKDQFSKNNKKFKLIYTTGAFDYLHHGHLNIFEKSKELCNKLLVGVSTDELIKKEKGRTSCVPFKERIRIVKAIRCVDEVIPQYNKNKQDIVNKYNIDAITVGDDWKGKYPSVSCEIIYLPYTKLISSTLIRKKEL
tara:strand:+ start:577 stop:1407 length:831 start_codon:yes stop_codon:yes gene_type:complete